MQGPVITLDALMAMSWDARWELIDGSADPVRPVNLKKCKPSCVSRLYTNMPMPHGDAFGIALDADNVYNGRLLERDETDHVDMRWVGYTCQLYDGELKMCPVHGAIGTGAAITGTCNGIAFKFTGVELEFGVWPEFLSLYKRQE